MSGWGKTSDLNISKYFFTGFATCVRALSCCKITFSCLWSYSSGFVWFEQLIINHMLLISPNAEQKLGAMNIQPGQRCWCMVGLTPTFSTVTIFSRVYIFHRQPGYNASRFTCERMPFDFSRLHLVRPQCPCFWIIPNPFEYFETVVRLIPNDSKSSASIWHGSLWSNTSNFLSSNFFQALERSLSSMSKSLFS